jgi:hypothetical protein
VKAQAPLPVDVPPKLSPDKIKEIQHTTHHWEHFVLCLHHQHHCPDGLKLHRNQANKGNNKHNGKSKTAP